MPTWIALLRGINVGGRNVMPMAKLKQSLESISCSRVQTYIQSGNVVFNSRIKNNKTLHKKVIDQIDHDFGFRPNLILLPEQQLRDAISNNPFPSAISQPKTLHFFFLDAEPSSDCLKSIGKLAVDSEQFELIGRVFYLHAPEGFGKSKLASSVERKLCVAATARNYATVEKLASMIAS